MAGSGRILALGAALLGASGLLFTPLRNSPPPEPPKMVQVCDVNKGKIIKVPSDKADRYVSKGHPACAKKPTPKPTPTRTK